MTQTPCGPGRVPVVEDLSGGQEVCLRVSPGDQVHPVPGTVDKRAACVRLSALDHVGEAHHVALLLVHVDLGPAYAACHNHPVLQLDGAGISEAG